MQCSKVRIGGHQILWPLLLLPILVLLASCGSDDRQRAGSTPESQPPAQLRPAIVIAGNGEGWVINRPANQASVPIWRVQRGRAPELTDYAPAYQALNGTSFTGDAVIGGVRCVAASSNDCATTVREIRRIRPDGTLANPVELSREPRPMHETDSIHFIGVADDGLWILVEVGILRIGRDWTVDAEMALPSLNIEPCVVEGRLYLLELLNPPPSSTPGGPPTPISPNDVDEQEYRILEPSAQGWSNVPNGAIRMPDGRASASCTSEGFQISSAQTWTRSSGWIGRPAEPPSMIDPSLARAESSTNRAYELQADGSLIASPRSQERAAVPVTLPLVQLTNRLAALYVDDSAPTLIACLAQSTARDSNPSATCELSDS